MKRLLCLLGVLVLLPGMVASVAVAGSSIGEVLSAAKTVQASGNNGARILTKGADIFFMDRLTTNATGAGEFLFSDGTKLAVGPSASLTVDAFVFKNKSSFQKLGLSAAKGTFRWISGSSPSSAYRIRTPLGTMGIRGTAFDVTIRNGRVYIALISGQAKFCTGSSCQSLTRNCDYVEASGGKLSKPKPIRSGFQNRESAAKIFPFLARPGQLSSRFRIGGGNCLQNAAIIYEGVKTPSVAPSGKPPPAPQPGPDPGSEPKTGCDVNCDNSPGNGN
jgi:FecR protein